MSLHHLGATRSRRALDHLLQTPDTFVWAALPGMMGATACVHVSPQLGAAFTQYTVAIEPGGSWTSASPASRFVYVLSGRVNADDKALGSLDAGGYFYTPPFFLVKLSAQTGARVVVIEKVYESLPEVANPQQVCGVAEQVLPVPLLGDASIEVRSLLPAESSYDLAVNTMTYQPGARLPMVEVHVMEHGLLMLEGEGIYRLGDCWYPVTAGDFIWMAPFCPQWFGALGSTPAKYLIYKDWNRHPLGVGV